MPVIPETFSVSIEDSASIWSDEDFVVSLISRSVIRRIGRYVPTATASMVRKTANAVAPSVNER